MRNRPYPWNERIPWLADIPEFLAYIGSEYAIKPAFVYERQNESVSVTYAQFVKDIYDLAAALRSRGWAGRHYALVGENSYEWILFFFAGVLAGGFAVPADRDLPSDELQRRLDSADADMLVYSAGYAEAADGLVCAERLSMSETAQLLRQGVEIFRQGGVARRDFAPDRDSPAFLFFTSSTTGTAKGTLLSCANLIFDVCAASRSFWEEGMNLLILPLHHIYGVIAALLSPLAGGSCSAVCPSVKRIKHFIEKYPPDCIFGVPMMVDAISAEIWRGAAKQNKTGILKLMLALSNALQKIGIDASGFLLGSVRKNFGGRLRSMVSGGGDLNAKHYRLFRGIGVNLLNGYGITECSAIVAVNRNHHWRDGSVGLPLRGVEVRIARDAAGKKSPGGACGEIQVRGQNVFHGYYKDEQATREAFTDDGWFKTGDLGYFNEDGFLFLTGRIKNLIITANGENVSPEGLEEKLYAIPGAAEVLVYQEGGLITAEIYPDPEDAGAAERIPGAVEEINHRLPLYAQIARTKLRDEEFPKTATMKIQRIGFGDNN